MASTPIANGAASPSSQAVDATQPISETLDPSTLDVDPDVSAAGQDPIQSESMARSASSRADGNKLDNDLRQEALDLTMEEARLPLRKDTSMREFLSKMDDYAPVIPDAVTFHALTLAGLKPPPLSSLNAQQQSATSSSTTIQGDSTSESDHVPLRLARLISLATQKFIADIATDAYQYSRMRTGVMTSNSLSANVNPGAAAAAAAAGAAGAGGAGGGAGGASGGPSGKSGANAHILGTPRAGFGGGGSGGGQNRAVLTLEDLGMSVGEYGVNIKRGEFYR